MATDILGELFNAELEYRKQKGRNPLTVLELDIKLKRLGYRRRADSGVRQLVEYISGERVGAKYPAIIYGLDDLETGKSAFHVDGRRDQRFQELQELRRDGVYAVRDNHIVEV